MFALRQEVGVGFIQFLLLAFFLLAPLPVIFYQIYALTQASYTLDRDGLKLRWGLYAEDIPLPEISWVRPASDLAFPLPLPLFSPTGVIRGTMNLDRLGIVEFLASDSESLLLVATTGRIFIISPQEPKVFLSAFQNAFEQGSITPITRQTSKPTAFMGGIWSDNAARILVLAALALTLALLVITSLIIPGKDEISLGFHSSGQPLTPGPSEQLLLLPVLAIFFFIIDLIVGAFFYRQQNHRPASYLLWVGGVITPILLAIAITFLV